MLGVIPDFLIVENYIYLSRIRLSLIGCTILLAVSGILRTHPGRRGSGPGRWAGRGRTLGWAGPRHWQAPPSGGSPSASFAGSRVCGAGPDTGTSAGREACAPDRQQRAAALGGGHLVRRSLDTTTPSRTGPAGRSYRDWAADGLARVRGSSGPGRLCRCNGTRRAGSRCPGSRWSRGRCLPDSGARLGPGRGLRPGGRTRAWLAGPGPRMGPGPRPPGLDDHVPGRTRVASDCLV